MVPTEELSGRLKLLSRELGFDYRPRRLNATRYATEHRADAHLTTPADLLRTGLPPWESFYTPELRSAVESAYVDDAAFHRIHA